MCDEFSVPIQTVSASFSNVIRARTVCRNYFIGTYRESLQRMLPCIRESCPYMYLESEAQNCLLSERVFEPPKFRLGFTKLEMSDQLLRQCLANDPRLRDRQIDQRRPMRGGKRPTYGRTNDRTYERTNREARQKIRAGRQAERQIRSTHEKTHHRDV